MAVGYGRRGGLGVNGGVGIVGGGSRAWEGLRVVWGGGGLRMRREAAGRSRMALEGG